MLMCFGGREAINSGINSPDDVEMQIIETAAAAVDTRGYCTTTFCRAARWLSDTGGLMLSTQDMKHPKLL